MYESDPESPPPTFWQRHRWWLVGSLSWKRLVYSLLFVYAALLLFAYLLGDRLLFRPPNREHAAAVEWLRVPVENGEAIAAVWRPVEEPRAVVLYCHGNANDLGGVQDVLDDWNAAGCSVLAFDYRGYGASDGRVSERNVNADVLAAYDHLVNELDVTPDRIVVVGRSLGGGPALYVATQRPVAGVLLESAFTSAFRVATRWPLLPFDRFPNSRRIAQLAVPVLIVHGDADRVVPFHHGLALSRTAREPKRFLRVPGAGHNDVRAIAGDAYWQAVDEWLEDVEKHRGR